MKSKNIFIANCLLPSSFDHFIRARQQIRVGRHADLLGGSRKAPRRVIGSDA